MLTLHQLKRSTGCDVVNGEVLAPGPGHSPRDRSMWIRPSATAPDGFICDRLRENRADLSDAELMLVRDYLRFGEGADAK